MKHVRIVNNNLFFEPKESIGFKRQNTFCMALDDIRILSVTTKMEFDDEMEYLTIVDKKGKLFHINRHFLNNEVMNFLKHKFHFKLKNFQFLEENYYSAKSIIYFPTAFKGRNLYSSGILNFFQSILRFFRIIHPADGIIVKEMKRYCLIWWILCI